MANGRSLGSYPDAESDRDGDGILHCGKNLFLTTTPQTVTAFGNKTNESSFVHVHQLALTEARTYVVMLPN